MVQDPRLQRLERRAGLEAQFVGQGAADSLIRLQRVGLPPGPIQSDHQLARQPFAQRVLAGQRVEFGDHQGVTAGSQIRLDSILERSKPCLLQTSRLVLSKCVIGKVRQRRTAPQRQRTLQMPGGRGPILSLERAPPLGHQFLESVDVEMTAVERYYVTVTLGPQHFVTKRTAQLRDIPLDQLGRTPGRVLLPQRVNDPVRAQHLAAVHEQ